MERSHDPGSGDEPHLPGAAGGGRRISARELSRRVCFDLVGPEDRFRPRPRRTTGRAHETHADEPPPRSPEPALTLTLDVSPAGLQLDADNPWPGLASYDEASRRFFYGREHDAAEL